jgi:hypothetical protein
MAWYWLSFVNNERPKGDRFVGALLIEAPSFDLAIVRSLMDGLNPGGDVEGFAVAPEYEGRVAILREEGMTYRLLSKAEALSIDERFEGEEER